jgi:hypothetical protein
LCVVSPLMTSIQNMCIHTPPLSFGFEDWNDGTVSR